MDIQEKLQVKLFVTQVKEFRKNLVDSKASFFFVCSNYSAKFLGKDKKRVIKKFATNQQSKNIFVYFNKLKKELQESEIKPDKVERQYLQYFNFNKSFLESGNLKFNRVVNVDLKSAYLNVLKNEGLITLDLFNQINKLKKKERLVTVGLLAYEPEFFGYEYGILKSYEKIKNINSDYFFFAVKRVNEIIINCKFLLDDDFIFSWVDGFYFLENSKKEKDVTQYLNNISYNYTREILTDFNTQFDNSNCFINFKKGSENKEFNIPTEINSRASYINTQLKNNLKNDYYRDIKIS